MNHLTKILAASALALGVAAAAAPSSATTIFASFDTGASNANNFTLTNSGDDATVFTNSSASGTSAAEVNTRFSFLGDSSTSDFFDLSSKFYFDGSVTDTPASFDGATYTQTGISGTLYFKFNGANGTHLNAFTLNKGDVLFSATFNDAWIQGNGGVGGLDVTVKNGGSAVFSSAYYDLSKFQPGTDEFTFHLGSVTDGFSSNDPSTNCDMNFVCTHVGSTALNSFRAHAAGEFQATVPEPTTWALMILGFGGAGAMLRRRKEAVA